jgi:hypothetical protein
MKSSMKNSMYTRITTKVAKAMGRGVYWSDRDDAWMTCEGYRVEGLVRAAIEAKPEENYTVQEALGVLMKALRADPRLKLSPTDSAVITFDPEVKYDGFSSIPTGRQVGYVVPICRGTLKMTVTPKYTDFHEFWKDGFCIQPHSDLGSVELSIEARSNIRYGTDHALWMFVDD